MKQRTQFLSTLCHYLDFDQYFFFTLQPFCFRHFLSTKDLSFKSRKLRGSFVLNLQPSPLYFGKIAHILVALFGT
jgi:hypothetical protein